jgi:hypothetical protein
MWWRSPSPSMLVPRFGYTVRCVAILTPKCSREVVAQFLCEYGLPPCSHRMLTFDNDPREVFSPAGRDCPSALVRFLLCLGVKPSAHPPTSPRFLPPTWSAITRSLSQECLQIHRPATLSQVGSAHRDVSDSLQPGASQSGALLWQPSPRVAYPAFPTLPAVPETVDSDRWLVRIQKRAFARTIRARGDLCHQLPELLCEPNPRWKAWSRVG